MTPFDAYPSYPVLPLRNAMYEAGKIVQVEFKRRISVWAIDAASAHGRIAVIARQRVPTKQDPGRLDLHEEGMLVEILAVERIDRVVHATLSVLRPVQILKTVSEAPYLEMHVTDGATSRADMGRLLAELTAGSPRTWLPEALCPLFGYLRHQLRSDLGLWDPSHSELTLQHKTSEAVAAWLRQSGLRDHFKLLDNPHMPAHGTYADIGIKHVSGWVAIEVKKTENLDHLLEDVRKLKAYKRGGSDTKVGVLVYPTRGDIDQQLLRKFTDDRELILVPCPRP